MKRLTETTKWTDPWFRKLRPASKLLFLYIIDNCDNAGFWEEDQELACSFTGLTPEQYSGAIQGLTRGLIGANGWYWVRTFLKHQKNENLNPSNNAHLQILRLIAEHSERFEDNEEFRGWLAPYEPLLRGPGIGKGKGREDGVQGKKPKTPKPTLVVEFPDSLNTEAFRVAWERWAKHRSEIKKPLTQESVNQQLQHCAEWGEARAIVAINHSIAGRYQGLFEPSNRNAANQQPTRISTANANNLNASAASEY